MVESNSGTVDRTFHALGHPVRCAVIAHLADRRASITEIASWFDLSLNGVSKHVKVLEGAGLLSRTVVGHTHYMAVRPAPLREANDWIAYHRHFWERRLDALERLLETTEESS